MILWELGQEAGHTRPLDQDILYKNLCEFWDIFKRNGIKCWLSHGTMLGVYRDNNFIPYDDDADVGADIATSQNRLKAEEELRQAGFYVPELGRLDEPVDPEKNMPYSDTVAIRDGEKIEVWWFEKRGKEYLYDVHRPPACLHHDQKYYDKLSKISFRGKRFEIPNYIDEYIVIMYGEDWNVPQEGRKYNVS